jgi:hypothetical protein
VDKEGRTPLMIACQRGELFDMVLTLSEKIEDFEGSAYIVLDLRMEKLILMQGLMEASHYIKLQRMV